jgi:molybdopterin-guanine dinucleotide biosynthesis protein A
MNRDRSAIVLAGGAGRRINGLNKPLLEISGMPMLKHVMDAVREVCDEIVVSVGSQRRGIRFENIIGDAKIAYDVREDFGPLEGIRQACRAVSRGRAAIVACDLPLLDPSIIEYLFNCMGPFDGAIPQWPDGKVEPLCSVFRTDSLSGAVEEACQRGERRIMNAFRALKIRYVPTEELEKIDAGLISFTNVNDEEDLEHARRMALIKYKLEHDRLRVQPETKIE